MIGQHLYMRCKVGEFDNSGIPGMKAAAFSINGMKIASAKQEKLAKELSSKIIEYISLPNTLDVGGSVNYRGILRIICYKEYLFAMRSFRVSDVCDNRGIITYTHTYIFSDDESGNHKTNVLNDPWGLTNLDIYYKYNDFSPSLMQRIPTLSTERFEKYYNANRRNYDGMYNEMFGYDKDLFMNFINSLCYRFDKNWSREMSVFLPGVRESDWFNYGGSELGEQFIVSVLRFVPRIIAEKFSAVSFWNDYEGHDNIRYMDLRVLGGTDEQCESVVSSSMPYFDLKRKKYRSVFDKTNNKFSDFLWQIINNNKSIHELNRFISKMLKIEKNAYIDPVVLNIQLMDTLIMLYLEENENLVINDNVILGRINSCFQEKMLAYNEICRYVGRIIDRLAYADEKIEPVLRNMMSLKNIRQFEFFDKISELLVKSVLNGNASEATAEVLSGKLSSSSIEEIKREIDYGNCYDKESICRLLIVECYKAEGRELRDITKCLDKMFENFMRKREYNPICLDIWTVQFDRSLDNNLKEIKYVRNYRDLIDKKEGNQEIVGDRLNKKLDELIQNNEFNYMNDFFEANLNIKDIVWFNNKHAFFILLLNILPVLTVYSYNNSRKFALHECWTVYEKMYSFFKADDYEKYFSNDYLAQYNDFQISLIVFCRALAEYRESKNFQWKKFSEPLQCILPEKQALAIDMLKELYEDINKNKNRTNNITVLINGIKELQDNLEYEFFFNLLDNEISDCEDLKNHMSDPDMLISLAENNSRRTDKLFSKKYREVYAEAIYRKMYLSKNIDSFYNFKASELDNTIDVFKSYYERLNNHNVSEDTKKYFFEYIFGKITDNSNTNATKDKDFDRISNELANVKPDTLEFLYTKCHEFIKDNWIKKCLERYYKLWIKKDTEMLKDLISDYVNYGGNVKDFSKYHNAIGLFLPKFDYSEYKLHAYILAELRTDITEKEVVKNIIERITKEDKEYFDKKTSPTRTESEREFWIKTYILFELLKQDVVKENLSKTGEKNMIFKGLMYFLCDDLLDEALDNGNKQGILTKFFRETYKEIVKSINDNDQELRKKLLDNVNEKVKGKAALVDMFYYKICETSNFTENNKKEKTKLPLNKLTIEKLAGLVAFLFLSVLTMILAILSKSITTVSIMLLLSFVVLIVLAIDFKKTRSEKNKEE